MLFNEECTPNDIKEAPLAQTDQLQPVSENGDIFRNHSINGNKPFIQIKKNQLTSQSDQSNSQEHIDLGDGSCQSEIPSPYPIKEIKSEMQSLQDEKYSRQYGIDKSPMQQLVNMHPIVAKFVEENPPLPLLPKSYNIMEDVPRSGGTGGLLKLTKFRGADHGKSKIQKDDAFDIFQFPPHIQTLKAVFTPIEAPQRSNLLQPPTPIGKQNNQTDDKSPKRPKRQANSGPQNFTDAKMANDLSSQVVGQKPGNIQERKNETEEIDQGEQIQQDKMTLLGEIVYQRSVLEFKDVKKEMKRDTVLEENLLDVKRLLKNSAFAAQAKQEDGNNGEKKSLVKVNVEPYYTHRNAEDKTILFESRFESGNLAAALKVNPIDYLLLLQNDVNTSGHTQWFFFRTTNVTPGQVRFNMLNLCKPDSLYNEGMKILVYSERMASHKDVGWHRAGTKIGYYNNGLRRSEKQTNGRSYYTHTFTYNYEYLNDTVYFAYSYPYTYTDMVEDLNKISNDQIKAQFCSRKVLCETLAGNKCEFLTITSKVNAENISKRKGVIITARVHPGESVGSWMMKGVLDFLTDPNSIEAELLRQNFVFKIVPMLNPDGVINGNYRCSLAGCDLNRRWKAPSKVLHPTIYHTKQLIAQFGKERELAVFCDFHGHSRRKNIFMYGCHVPGAPEDSRLFPFILSAINPFFIYSDSRFGNQKNKESTARMALFNEHRMHPCIYTMESSFCGNDQGPFAKYHFSTENLMQTGMDFCRSLLIHQQIQSPPSTVENFLKNINFIYNHYKTVNDALQNSERDQDVVNMKFYEEKIRNLKQEGIPISTNYIRKALRKVLRQTAEVFLENETQSSQGSDKAPSEDNLDPDEIAAVIPLEEDPDLMKKAAALFMSKVEKQPDLPPKANIISPVKRRVTLMPKSKAGSLHRAGTKNLDGLGSNSKVRKQQDEESEKNQNTTNLEEQKSEQANLDQFDIDTNIHKKKIKKNVDSRDACTQTDRSDYMLIKQRQKQKEIIEMAKQGKLPPGVTPQQLIQNLLLAEPSQYSNSTSTQPPSSVYSSASKPPISRGNINFTPQANQHEKITGYPTASKLRNHFGIEKDTPHFSNSELTAVASGTAFPPSKPNKKHNSQTFQKNSTEDQNNGLNQIQYQNLNKLQNNFIRGFRDTTGQISNSAQDPRQNLTTQHWVNQNYQLMPPQPQTQFITENFGQEGYLRSTQSSSSPVKRNRTRAGKHLHVNLGVGISSANLRSNQSQGQNKHQQKQGLAQGQTENIGSGSLEMQQLKQSQNDIQQLNMIQVKAQRNQKPVTIDKNQNNAQQYVAQRKMLQSVSSKAKSDLQLDPFYQVQQTPAQQQKAHPPQQRKVQQNATNFQNNSSEEKTKQQQQQMMVLENQLIKQTLEMQQQNLNPKQRQILNSSVVSNITPVATPQHKLSVMSGNTPQQSQQQYVMSDQQQFFQVHRIIPSATENNSQPSNQKQGQGFKINIVHVHNEYNIQNNIYIQQQQQKDDAANHQQQQKGKQTEVSNKTVTTGLAPQALPKLKTDIASPVKKKGNARN